MSRHVLAITTADELWQFSHEGQRCELVEGHLRLMEPSSFEHGRIAATASLLLGVHVRENDIGVTLGAETGFILAREPDTVRAPDAAFVSRARADAVGATERYWPGAPDFAVEVISPNDSFGEVEAKASGWLQAGTTAVLVLDPRRRSATVYRTQGDVRVYDETQEIDFSDAVAGWQVTVAKFFD
jgi:Uma2 family endonuclease